MLFRPILTNNPLSSYSNCQPDIYNLTRARLVPKVLWEVIPLFVWYWSYCLAATLAPESIILSPLWLPVLAATPALRTAGP
jgi:hypothetical protein